MALMPDKGNPPSPLKAWVRALERTAAIERDHSLTLPVVIERLAARAARRPGAARQRQRPQLRGARGSLQPLRPLGSGTRARSG